jgi:hypothetical protein
MGSTVLFDHGSSFTEGFTSYPIARRQASSCTCASFSSPFALPTRLATSATPTLHGLLLHAAADATRLHRGILAAV